MLFKVVIVWNCWIQQNAWLHDNKTTPKQHQIRQLLLQNHSVVYPLSCFSSYPLFWLGNNEHLIKGIDNNPKLNSVEIKFKK